MTADRPYGMTADQLAEALADAESWDEPQTSRPTSFMGAPDLGTGWNDAFTRPAAWKAFGKDPR